MGPGLFILLAMLGAAILGFLIAWILRGSGLTEWREKYHGIKGDYDGLDLKYKEQVRFAQDLETTRVSLASDKDRFQTEAGDWRTKYNRLKSDYEARSSVSGDYKNLKSKYSELEDRFKGKEATIRDLMEANRQLETEKTSIASKLSSAPTKVATTEKVVEKVVTVDNLSLIHI